MALAKLTITPQSSTLKPIEVLFNPNNYSIVKPVTWNTDTAPQHSTSNQNETQRLLNAPPLKFGGGGSRTLTFDQLFFDVTEPVEKKGQRVTVPDVRRETDQIVALTRIEPKTGQPPICQVSWGGNSADFPFTGVVTNLTQRFTLFKSDGTPVRATLTVVFTEYLVPEADLRQTDPELTTHVVKRGETLSIIAAEVYGDPTLWRIIAQANRLDDPRRLEIGRRLTIPALS